MAGLVAVDVVAVVAVVAVFSIIFVVVYEQRLRPIPTPRSIPHIIVLIHVAGFIVVSAVTTIIPIIIITI